MPTDTTNPATDTIATQLAAFAHGLKPDMLPAAVVEQAKLLMLDALGIALASSRHDFAHCAYRGLHALGGAGDSAVMGAFAPLPLRDAVLMNGILVHGLDFDDTHPGAITHPSASAFPLALGLAAQQHATGAEMITAHVLAIEVAARLGAAARGGFHDVGFHPTGLVGALGCALALRAAGLRAEEVASVQVLLPAGVHPVVCEPVAAKRRPANVYESQFSIHHLVALALLRGEMGLAELDAANLSDLQVQALADRIEHAADPDADYPTFFSVQAVRTVARRDGDHYVINGTKTWISNGIHGQAFAVLVKTDPEAQPRHRGMSLFICEKGPGFTSTRKLEKLGYKGIDSAELVFDNFRVPAANLVGGVEGQGFKHVMGGLELGRINVAARGVGVARACLEESVAYAQLRRTFGKPICEHQAIQLKLADMATRAEAARLLVEHRAGLRRGPALRHGSRHGQAVRQRGGGRELDGGLAHPRGLWLLEGNERRALLPRRAAAVHWRWHQRIAAPDHFRPAGGAQPGLMHRCLV